MGCDIHTHVEVRRDGRWEYAYGESYDSETREFTDGPFGWRDYGVFGFLADVRNYSHSPVIAEPRGLPQDMSAEVRAEYGDDGWHSASWLTVAELLAYDYDQVFWDRRITKQIGPNYWDHAALADEGEGQHVSLREFLGDSFFADLDKLSKLGALTDVRIVFWFDN